MTDRELVEKAAKAAGIVGCWERDWSYVQERYYFNIPYDNQGLISGFEWNPLTDDRDALRLAVKLGLRVGTDGQSVHPCIECWRPHYNDPRVVEPCGDDPYTATRRAIVRAAAATQEKT